MSVNPSPIAGFAGQFFDNNGVILSGGKIYTYAAGTTTPQATYTSATGVTPHANPIVLDSAGRVPGGEIWLTDSLIYKFVIETSTAVLIGTYDNITGVNSNFVNYTVQEEVITATAGQTVFNLTTINYTPGTNSLSVFIDGVNQYVGDSYLETDSDTVTFTAGLHVGAEVKFTTAVQSTTGAVDASIVTFTGFNGQTGDVQDLADNDGSDWIGFEPAGAGTTPRSAQEKLRDVISVKDFGAVGDGAADDTAAFNAAIAWANAKGGDDRSGILGSTIFIPEGRYRITSALNPITVSGVTFTGASKTSAVLLLSVNGAAFTFGNGVLTPVGGGITNLKIEYPAGPVGAARIVDVDRAFSLSFENLMLQDVGTFLRLGTASNRIAGGIIVTNVQAAVGNDGYPVFDMRYGAGLTVSDCQMFVLGVLPPVDPAPMTTVYGTSVFKCDIGFWDTLQVSNCIFERFDLGVACTAGAGMVYQNFFFTNVIMDFFRRWPFYLEANGGGIISGIRCDSACWYVSWEESCVEIQAATGAVDNVYFAGAMVIAGKYIAYANAPNAKSLVFEGVEVGAGNRLGTVNAAFSFAALCRGFSVINCKGNFDLTGSGLPWRADYGIAVGADCASYQISNCFFDGAIGGYTEATHTVAGQRVTTNNNNANYAGYQAGIAVAASGVTYTNLTSYTQEWFLSGGTLTGDYLKNGVSLGQPSSLTITLYPNETLRATYSVAPVARVFVAP